ncbi:hypothetical protein ccbrp13_39180 [Ktedonobacteria bacterium brp13]|nr:hypothetical protein ccbrp13_39180 [Ktedonobacteria bacterium brp13]
MQSKQDLPISLKALLTLIVFGIFGLVALLTLILQILFPLIFLPFLSFSLATPDMPHRAARIAFVAFCGLVWLVGIGYLIWLTVRSRRAQVLGIPMDPPKWITSTTPLTPLRAIALLVGFSFFATPYQMIFANEPFTISLVIHGMLYPTMMVIWCMSLQSLRAKTGEQKHVQDQYAGLAIAGYILGAISFFFVGTIYLFSPPFAIIGIFLSLFGCLSSTHRAQANWGLGLSVIGVLAPIIVIMTSMTLSHCSGWPGLNCSIPVAIDELFH